MRIAVAENLQSRNGSLSKDAKVTNGLLEANGDMPRLRKRPGSSDFGLVRVGVGQMLTNWKGIKTVIGDYYSAGATYTGGYTNSTTWNSADKTANVTLSGADLVATTTAVGYSGVRSVYGHSSGTWYFELTVTSGNQGYFGFCTATHDFTFVSPVQDVIYADIAAIGSYIENYLGGENFNFLSGVVNTDVVSCLYDADIGAIQFFKNGVVLGSTTVTPGTTLHAYYGMPSIVGSVTANFAGAFVYTPSASSTALVVTTPSLPFQSANTGETASTQYIMFKNKEYGWYANSANALTKIVSANYPAYTVGTVPGVIYLDTYFIVMDTTGKLYNSARNDPSTWGALDFITAANEPGAGVALAKSQNYAIALKEYSIEPFYNAANPVGSILSPVDNGFLKIGCASAGSVATKDESIVFMSQSRQKGRGIQLMVGLQAQEISTPDIERVLNADDLATVHSYCIRIDGHDLYVLTLVSSNITLVYDFTSKAWAQWSSLTLGSALSFTVASLTRSGQVATWNSDAAHGLSDGDPVLISGVTQTEYNGIFQTKYVSDYTFTFEVTGSPATPATGSPVITPYTESYFKYTKYVNYSGVDLFLHESDGHLYAMDSNLYQDNGLPINFVTRTSRMDGGITDKKTMSRITFIGDIVADTGMVRWSDDDYATNRPYRTVDLDEPKSMVRRCGSFVDRSIEFRHIGNTKPILDAIEIEVQR